MEAHFQTSKINLPGLLTIALIAAGLWECILGWAQLLGFSPSLHPLYPATGSFYNPGPYCGFLAMLMPVALKQILKPLCKFSEWAALTYLIPAVAIMPVLMGRTGWIAAIAGCLLVSVGCGKIKRPRPAVLLGATVVTVLAVAVMFYLKPASALGRLFLWRIGLSAVFQHPFTGVGWNYVAGALGDAQESYFTAHPQSVFAGVAGSPEYAFNEFLQTAIAFGIPAMLLFIAVLLTCGIAAWRGGAYGITGGIASFCVVCFSSYPLQFPEFIAAVGLILVAAVASAPGRAVTTKAVACILIAVGSVSASICIKHRKELADDWTKMRYTCRYNLDNRAIQLLDSLSTVYGQSPKYLFDYGKALRESGFYDKSTALLMRGAEMSSDPMFLNLIGRNCQDTGHYGDAESYFIRAANRLPGRMYPYYLLARLYSDSAFCDTARFMSVYEKISQMSPKIMSPAIEQMRRETDSIRITLRR